MQQIAACPLCPLAPDTCHSIPFHPAWATPAWQGLLVATAQACHSQPWSRRACRRVTSSWAVGRLSGSWHRQSSISCTTAAGASLGTLQHRASPMHRCTANQSWLGTSIHWERPHHHDAVQNKRACCTSLTTSCQSSDT